MCGKLENCCWIFPLFPSEVLYSITRTRTNGKYFVLNMYYTLCWTKMVYSFAHDTVINLYYTTAVTCMYHNTLQPTAVVYSYTPYIRVSHCCTSTAVVSLQKRIKLNYSSIPKCIRSATAVLFFVFCWRCCCCCCCYWFSLLLLFSHSVLFVMIHIIYIMYIPGGTNVILLVLILPNISTYKPLYYIYI